MAKLGMVKQQSNSSLIEEEWPFLAPQVLYRMTTHGKVMMKFELNFWQRIFITLEDPSTCKLGQIISTVMMICIFLSSIIFIISTDPSVKHQPSDCADPACDNDPKLCPGRTVCEPVAPLSLTYIDAACVVFFTIDYVTRICIVPWIPSRLSGIFDVDGWDAEKLGASPDPDFPPRMKFRKYVLRPMNLIDLVAILPFYIAFVSASGASLTIFRILRLGRILRLTKAGKNNKSMAVLINTMKSVKDILLMLLFYVILCVIVIAALVFQFEQGVFKATADYPDGAYLRPSYNMQGEGVSPYTSIWASIYWALVTGTTLGYGDLYPTTVGGRIITCLWIFCGILVLGLPISIIGSNFTVEMEKMEKQEEVKTRMLKVMKKRASMMAVIRPEDMETSLSSLHGGVDVSTQTEDLVELSQDEELSLVEQLAMLEEVRLCLELSPILSQ